MKEKVHLRSKLLVTMMKIFKVCKVSLLHTNSGSHTKNGLLNGYFCQNIGDKDTWFSTCSCAFRTAIFIFELH